MKQLWLSLLAMTLASLAPCQEEDEARILRHPHYHDGKIVFSYLGDLWIVKEDGTDLRRLTVHVERELYPRFSPDGKSVAFSSKRFGNYDVFVVPTEGERRSGSPLTPTTTLWSAGRRTARESSSAALRTMRGGQICSLSPQRVGCQAPRLRHGTLRDVLA